MFTPSLISTHTRIRRKIWFIHNRHHPGGGGRGPRHPWRHVWSAELPDKGESDFVSTLGDGGGGGGIGDGRCGSPGR